MKVIGLEVFQIRIPFKKPFQFGHTVQENRDHIIVSVHADQRIGWGEAGLLKWPFYNAETTAGAFQVVKDVLAPILVGNEIRCPQDLQSMFSQVIGNRMAQAAVDFAVWDLFAMSSGVSLSEYIGGTRESIPVGISLGQRATAQEFVDAVEEALGRGFKRIKCKISPGFPIELLEDVRRRHPELPLSVDANGTFSAANFDELCRYDSLSLTMIEQPFHPKDFLLSAELQKSIHTDICLDESIEDLFDLELAHHLKAGKSINIKPARVGGLTQSIAIRDRALEMGLSVWVGGLMETGIGRAVNLAFASTVDEAFPHDIAECGRYCSDELVKEVFCLMPHARLKVPVERSGLGVTVNQEALSRYTVEHARVF